MEVIDDLDGAGEVFAGEIPYPQRAVAENHLSVCVREAAVLGLAQDAPSYNSNLGKAIPRRIATKIQESDLVLIILSTNSSKSQWVHHEIGMVFFAKRSVVTVVVSRKVPLPEILQAGQVISLVGNKATIDTAWAELISLIEMRARKKLMSPRPRRRPKETNYYDAPRFDEDLAYEIWKESRLYGEGGAE